MIEFNSVRYIKLGKGGCWNDISLDNAQIHFGYGKVSHALASTGDYDAIRESLIKLGRKPGAASDDARAVCEFYSLASDCVWITFARGRMWWTFAEPEIIWLGGDAKGADHPDHGQRYRNCTGWRSVDADGFPLAIESLSTSLTKVAAYRRTLCSVDSSQAYIKRRINCLVDPLIERANEASEALLAVIDQAVVRLHQSDFETLVDLIFARSGWHRVSALGGHQEFIDLAAEQPTTGERAAVQVKSETNQSELDKYVELFDAAGTFQRFFFVCHSTAANIVASPDWSNVHLWQGRSLSNMVLRLGLSDWILKKLT